MRKVKTQVYGAWLFSGKDEPGNEVPPITWKAKMLIGGRYDTPSAFKSLLERLGKIEEDGIINWDWLMVGEGDKVSVYSRKEIQEILKGRKGNEGI